MKDFTHKKKFGQNFISDTNLLRAIVREADVDKQSQVLEIGAGEGSLTTQLALSAEKVVSYEIDTDLIPILQENLKELKNVVLINKDIMKVDIQEIENQFSKPYILVANLPYYITTPIIFKFLEEATILQQLSIMVQKEVAQRICAKPGTKDYGIISVIIDSMGDAQISRLVNRNMFFPMPNVDSAVVKIVLKNKYNIEAEKFSKLVNGSFAMRRKTLVNNLMACYSYNRDIAENVVKEAGFDLNIRGEQLTTEMFVKLYNVIYR